MKGGIGARNAKNKRFWSLLILYQTNHSDIKSYSHLLFLSSTWVVFNNFLLIDATDRKKISSDQRRLFFAISLYPLSFFANTPFKDKLLILTSKPCTSRAIQTKLFQILKISLCEVNSSKIKSANFCQIFPPKTEAARSHKGHRHGDTTKSAQS